MTPVFIGAADEILGFALAGAATFAAATDAEVEKAIDRARKNVDEPIIFIVHDGVVDAVDR